MNIYKFLIAVLLCLFFLAFISCKKDNPVDPPITNLTELKGPYLGAPPPGMDPIRFAPDNLFKANTTWFYHGSPVFSPDGNEMYFVKYLVSSNNTEICFTKRVSGQWTIPEKASFSLGNFVNNPFFGQSNDTLYFKSNHSTALIYRVVRTSNGWSTPVSINIPIPSNYSPGHQFSITRNKTIYFELSADNGNSPPDIYRSRLINGIYTDPENLGSPINTSIGEILGYVDPDEKFMIFCNKDPEGYGWHDMYISRRNQDGRWQNPINLGPKINTSWEDSAPIITPDGKYFFFTTIKTGDQGYTPYWVDTKILDSF